MSLREMLFTRPTGMYSQGMGRAPKPPSERKSTDHQITTRLDQAERAQLEKLAVEMRLSAGGVMRQALAELYERVFSKARR
jgi:hypothetical protein